MDTSKFAPPNIPLKQNLLLPPGSACLEQKNIVLWPKFAEIVWLRQKRHLWQSNCSLRPGEFLKALSRFGKS
jgi:hypothetical protein